LWKRIREQTVLPPNTDPSLGHLLFDCLLGVLSCLGLVVLTNSLFTGKWLVFGIGIVCFVCFGGWLLQRVLADTRKAAIETSVID
jgi:hypothetical protein